MRQFRDLLQINAFTIRMINFLKNSFVPNVGVFIGDFMYIQNIKVGVRHGDVRIIRVTAKMSAL